MKLIRTFLASLAALALIASFTPAFAFAQSYTNCANNNGNWFTWNTNSSCSQGQLMVYVQVLNANNGFTKNPSDFAVTVSGQNASPSSFPGSQSGTFVSVAGSYSVTAASMENYQPSYSQGCNGSVVNNNQATCVITESASNSNYYPYPQPYPYGYQPAPLTCSASQPTVALGQTVTFNAAGGDNSGPYNWQALGRTYYSTGPTLSITMQNTGTQLVEVTHNSQTATCSITVAATGYYPAPISTITPGSPAVYVTPTYVPALPNTGFEPISAQGVAYAFAALIAAALIAYPYARKAFASILG